MSLIDACFAKLKTEGRKALTTFTMACDPNFETSKDILLSLPDAGVDIIELGMPFSDPMADGPVIQEAGLRALQEGGSVKKTLELASLFRKQHADTPLILMGYYNPIYHYGAEAFAKDAAKAGVDGIILVDLPYEEEAEFKPALEAEGVAFIRLIAPTSVENRLPVLLENTQGFIYYIAVAGITGSKSADEASLTGQVKKLKEHTDTPVIVGFGIKTPEQAKAILQHADGIVVGSALIQALQESKAQGVEFIRQIAAAI